MCIDNHVWRCPREACGKRLPSSQQVRLHQKLLLKCFILLIYYRRMASNYTTLPKLQKSRKTSGPLCNNYIYNAHLSLFVVNFSLELKGTTKLRASIRPEQT